MKRSFRLHEKSTSTPVEIGKALKRTATNIAGPLEKDQENLMQSAISMASKERVGIRTQNFKKHYI